MKTTGQPAGIIDKGTKDLEAIRPNVTKILSRKFKDKTAEELENLTNQVFDKLRKQSSKEPVDRRLQAILRNFRPDKKPVLSANATAQEFCQRYSPLVLSTIKRRLLGYDRAIIEDIQQEAFTIFLLKWRFGFESTSARRFIFGIVRNLVRMKRREKPETNIDEIERLPDETDTTTFDDLLTPQERSFALDTYNLTNAQAANLYGLSESTVKRKKSVIADKLKQSKRVMDVTRFRKAV